MAEALFAVKVGGDYACFSRPEFKVERVTYDVMTPSAARGVLEAIFWKPEMRWEVREIWLLKPIKTTTILRNEVGRRQGGTPFCVEDARQQRTSLVLKDVAYVIRAALTLWPHTSDPLVKYVDQMQRRVERGRCHHTPYLGTREFAAWFEPADGTERPEPVDRDLGTMLFDLAFCEGSGPGELSFYRHGPGGKRVVEGRAQALFFHAVLEQGILRVPPELYAEKYRLEGIRAS